MLPQVLRTLLSTEPPSSLRIPLPPSCFQKVLWSCAHVRSCQRRRLQRTLSAPGCPDCTAAGQLRGIVRASGCHFAGKGQMKGACNQLLAHSLGRIHRRRHFLRTDQRRNEGCLVP